MDRISASLHFERKGDKVASEPTYLTPALNLFPTPSGETILSPNLPNPRSGESWTRDRIQHLLQSERFDYQAIQLPYGLSTSGHDRSATARQIFPLRLEGQSVLDIGSSLGFFCFEARRRGAGRVVGLDFDPHNVRKARLLCDILGETIDFRLSDLDSEAIAERFDHVLCLNVLHHLSDPILSLDKLISATRRRLVLEVATLGRHDAKQIGLNWFVQRALQRTPALIVGRGTSGAGVRQFYFTPPGIENLLRYRRGCFAKVEILPSSFKDRFLVIAHKRRIGELIVVAGISGCGFEAALRRIDAHMGGGHREWGAPLRAEQYPMPTEPELERLSFLYEIDRPLTMGAGNYAHDPALDVLESAQRVRVVTVWNSPEETLDLIRSQMAIAHKRSRKRLEKLHEHLSETDRLVAQFRAWLDHLNQKGIEHRVLVEARGWIMSAQDWELSIAEPLTRAPSTPG